ncbi:CxxxxCH/CxxCH domain-containing protein [Geobacter sp. DSM 9736]|uniref:cytochrome c3 family protein n=1 Tax=Geobacter sp. DSM 9736 TaxID=1277350 RepID=UPI000B508900|nr:CxxxxCH/CxxCH domain-containing protein [Geobacter sp. DSM 9736]SNB47896.1 Geobacter sulfurreducens CxxxxCH...CXXCH domain-containing protein [Geobacter sp. DSM 9736]
MKRSAVQYLIFATVLLLMPSVVLAADGHELHQPYECATCHKASTHKDLGVSGRYSNLCVGCHKPGNVDLYTGDYYVRSFSYGDMANPYKNDPGLNGKKDAMQLSHKWVGSDTVPAAGAVPPTTDALNPRTNEGYALLGTVSCTRCHNVKLVNTNKPYLRAQIDDMCLDCHRPRNTTSHLEGTHPVNVSYTSATSKPKLFPGQYYPRPLNSNPDNKTSQLGTKGGKILCTTCHGIHYVDSNSRTYDNFSSLVMGRLSSSQGNLLKTDLRGGTANDRNICTNCHKSADDPANTLAKVKNHNGKKNQNVQCADCHGGHVEYDPADPTALKNVYLINRYMNISTTYGAVRNKRVLFQDVSNKNYNQDQYGVCVACHVPTPRIEHTNKGGVYCNKCHVHEKGFSADCTTCHGFPPTASDKGGGPYGYADTPYDYSDPQYGVYKDESKTPHAKHAAGGSSNYSYDCAQCHKGYTHMDGKFQDVFIDPVDTLAGSAATYTKASPGTCNNVYCHSNGAQPAVYKNPTWDQGKNTVGCNFCHDAKPTTNAHSRHVAGGAQGKAYDCEACHSATVTGSTIIKDRAKHVDGRLDVVGADGCLDCHNNAAGGPPAVTPDFKVSTTGQCGSCHANPPGYAHNAHISAVYGPVFGADTLVACAKCHTYTGELSATHVDGKLDNTLQAVACGTCHPGTLPNWKGIGRVTCESCHSGGTQSVINGIAAPAKKLSTESGHGKFEGARKTCADCHDGDSAHIDASASVHRKRVFDNMTGFNKGCTYCHNDEQKIKAGWTWRNYSSTYKIRGYVPFYNMSTHFTKKGGSAVPNGQDMACSQCHDLHGTTNLSMVRTKIAYTNSTTWTISFANRSTIGGGDGPVNKVTNRGLCQVCHTKTKYFRAGVDETGHPDRNCFSCHPHNARGGAFSPSDGTCDTCHGYPPIPKSSVVGPEQVRGTALFRQTYGVENNFINAKFEDYSGGGGVHMWHVDPAAKASDGWNACAICHTGGSMTNTQTHVMRMPLKQNISNVTVKIDPRWRFNDAVLPTYTGARLVNPPEVNKTGSCISVGCHFKPTGLIGPWSADR